ncbi:MAG: outer membrane beta-barrel protein [Kofleriaceae bacterium]
MNRRFTLFAGALVLATLGSLVQTDTAEAGRYRFGGGGRFHARVSGHVSVGYRGGYGYRPYRGRGWSTGGRIYVGPRYNYYPRYSYYPRYYYYTPVPSYYGVYTQEQYYYPVAPQPQVQAQPIVVAQRPELPKLGIGLFAGGVSVEDQSESSDVGVLGRLRLGNSGLLVEGELGKTSYENDARVDRRLGGALVYEFGAYNKLAPYVLAGIGVQQADVEGDFKTTQNFGELGVGLRWALTPRFHLLFDVRAGSRTAADEDDVATGVARTSGGVGPSADESEEYTRARFAAMLYF